MAGNQRLAVEHVVPEFFQLKEADVTRMNMKLTDDHLGQPRLNLIVEWDDDDTSTAWKWTQMTGTPYRQLVSLPCDGPCGSTYPATELVDFGKCEHSICVNCLGEMKECPECNGWLDELLVCKLILVEKHDKKLLKRSLTEEWYGSQTMTSTRQLLASLAKKPLRRLMAGSLQNIQPVSRDTVHLVDLLSPGQSTLYLVAVFDEDN